MYKLTPNSYKINQYSQKTNSVVSKSGLSGTKMHMSAPKTNIINAAKMNINLPNTNNYTHKTNFSSLKSNYNPPQTSIITKKATTNIFQNSSIYTQKSDLNSHIQIIPKSNKIVQIQKNNLHTSTFKMNVSAQQGYNLIQEHSKNLNFIILDVRTNSQFNSQRLLNSIHYTLSDLEIQLQKLDKNKIYLVYCRSGARSSTATSIMRRNGFNNAMNMVGGIQSWSDHNYPTVQGQSKTKNMGIKIVAEQPKINSKSNINAVQAHKLISQNQKNSNFVLLDVRSISENASQRIDNSIHIPVSDIEARLPSLDKHKIYLVYCRSGARSSTAAGILRSNGFNNVINMVGGIGNWIDNNYPTVEGQKSQKKPQPIKIKIKANIEAQEAYQLIKDNNKNSNFVILDVRSYGQYSSQKIQNSINISVSDIQSHLRNLDKSKIYLVYCRSGGRSSSAASILKQNGFQNVTSMSGGISSWISYGFPIV